jgi:hypothetical protein
MKWTTPEDLRAQVMRLWNRGLILASLCCGEDIFPRRLNLKTPKSAELSTHYSDVRDWIARLSKSNAPYRIEWRTLNHRVLGSNEIPARVWIDSTDAALRFIGRQHAAQTFAALVEHVKAHEPALLPWLKKRPLRALELVEDWDALLHMIAWMKAHPRPDIYLRQIDLPGVHTKFIEQHRGVLAELFDLALPAEYIDENHSGVSGFCARYGFRDKPMRVRFRILDPDIQLVPGAAAQDITLSAEDFAHLNIPVERVFITENEINFLAFPACARSIVLFGAGYGFANLTGARWLRDVDIRYWGDIDTHGFAILNQIRKLLPHTVSFLMDSATLLAHRDFWGTETHPEKAELPHLNATEAQLYTRLRHNHWGKNIRLEQEKISYGFLRARLETLPKKFQDGMIPE